LHFSFFIFSYLHSHFDCLKSLPPRSSRTNANGHASHGRRIVSTKTLVTIPTTQRGWWWHWGFCLIIITRLLGFAAKRTATAATGGLIAFHWARPLQNIILRSRLGGRLTAAPTKIRRWQQASGRRHMWFCLSPSSLLANGSGGRDIGMVPRQIFTRFGTTKQCSLSLDQLIFGAQRREGWHTSHVGR